MYWLAILTGLAVLGALVTRGSLRRLFRRPVRGIPLLVVGLGLQIALELLDLSRDRIDDLGFGLFAGSWALILGFCLANVFTLRGIGVVAVGVAMNALVVALNMGMPTSDRLVDRPSGARIEVPVERTAKERPEHDDDLLGFLGQIIRLPENPIDDALSFGDLVIALGVIDVAFHRSRRSRSTLTDDGADDSEDTTLEPVTVDDDAEPEPELVPAGRRRRSEPETEGVEDAVITEFWEPRRRDPSPGRHRRERRAPAPRPPPTAPEPAPPIEAPAPFWAEASGPGAPARADDAHPADLTDEDIEAADADAEPEHDGAGHELEPGDADAVDYEEPEAEPEAEPVVWPPDNPERDNEAVPRSDQRWKDWWDDLHSLDLQFDEAVPRSAADEVDDPERT